jgi:hypothetical protein
MLLTSSIAAYFAQVSKLATQSQSGSRGHRLSSWLWQRYMLRSHPAAFNSQVFRLEAMLESDRLQASLSDHRLHQMLVCPFWGEQVFSNRFYECFWMSDDTGLWWRSFTVLGTKWLLLLIKMVLFRLISTELLEGEFTLVPSQAEQR